MSKVPSFFDNKENENIPFQFIKPDPSQHQETLKTSPTIRDGATCKGPIYNATIKGSFALHETLLVYYENEQSIDPILVLELTNSRLKLFNNENLKQCGFILTKNGSTFEFCFQDQYTVDFWVNALRKICIMTNFHEEYKGIKRLGKGSFARVYLINSRTNGKNYAAKAFAKHSNHNSGTYILEQVSLLNEIEILRSIDHPNIIQLYEVQESENTVYLIMEYVESKTLQEILKSPDFKNSYSEAQIMYLMHSILEALAYLASKGIMHRDLKPDNILVEKGGKIRIIDFGLAENVNSPKNIYHKCGTTGYIAPEVFTFNSANSATFYNHSCDMFSAGCVLYYMLFGKPLFDTSKKSSEGFKNTKDFDYENIIERLKNENETNGKINKSGMNLLLELLQANPEKRISAGDAFVHPYFKPIISRFIKFASSKDIIFDTKNQTNKTKKENENQRIYFFKEDINPFGTILNRQREENSFCLEFKSQKTEIESDSPQLDKASKLSLNTKNPSDEVGEIGNENCSVQSYLEKYKEGMYEKHPSKLLESQGKVSHVFIGKCV